ncbi:MAG: hypothetical protein IT340_19970 [Chloroflexi bacterium]|nr:hypothetical protein [Chloroflexota bacterium]
MAVINIRLPDAVYARVVAAFVAAYHRGDTPPNDPERFLRQQLRRYVLEVLGNAEIEQAARLARLARAGELEAELNAVMADADVE